MPTAIILREALFCYNGHYFTGWIQESYAHPMFVQWLKRAERVVELDKKPENLGN